MGLDYQKLLESKRHNLATENVDARNASSNERNAASNESNASSNRLNADTNKFIASFKDREVKATESQASSAARNATSNEKNAESNAISAAARTKDSETNRLKQQIDASLRDLKAKEIDNDYLAGILKYAPPAVQKTFAGTEVLGDDLDASIAITGDTALSEIRDWISALTQLFSLVPGKRKK